MRKVLIGCGAVLVLLLLIFAGFAWWGFNKFKDMRGKIEIAQKTLAQTDQKFPFAPPADGLVKQDRFTEWLKVLGGIKAQAKEMENIDFKNESKLDIAKKMMSLPATVMEQKAQTLLRHGMSNKEYEWIKSQVYGALTSGDALNDPAMAKMVKAVDAATSATQEENPIHSAARMKAAPMTSVQIAHTLKLLKENEVEFVSLSDGLRMDFASILAEQQIEAMKQNTEE